jgi:hypothetical protein
MGVLNRSDELGGFGGCPKSEQWQQDQPNSKAATLKVGVLFEILLHRNKVKIFQTD